MHLRTPTIKKRTVVRKTTAKLAVAFTPRRKPNAAYRTREYLTETEINKLITVARTNRWGHRDATIVLTAYRHGLRAAELVDLR